MTNNFDLVIIGGGPAGYTAAIRASQLNMTVACIEKDKALGGTCLNVGCIPSKAMLHYSEQYYSAKHHFAEYGIEVTPKLNLLKMLEQKNKVVSDLQSGIKGLFAKNKVQHFIGTAQIASANKIIVQSDGSSVEINAKNILIATGSKVASIPGIEFDEEHIVSSSGALSFKEVPEKLIVVGAGYIGLELGSVWARLGSKVTVVEYGDKILPAVDQEIAKAMQKVLIKNGMDFHFNTKVQSIEKTDGSLLLKASCQDKLVTLQSNKILIAVGRKPYTEQLGLEEVGIVKEINGQIIVNNKYQTSVTNIYAVGDVISGPMLAHKAEEEAVAAVENIAGKVGIVHYNLIPSVIYTNPEIASVGATEEELKAKNINYKVGKFPLMANSRARAISETSGMVKILADFTTDEILGAHIMAKDAGSLISEITLGMSFRAAAEDIASICHPHPTLSEAIKEAALAVDSRAINF
jgi:dihydrolipoamide dehydrogenase